MVLAGASLTACVAFYIFPYDWPFSLAMTLGSILAATDPVAVSALLEEVGAPPRLKVHISGESLFNDGSAMVFYTLFSDIFLYSLGIGLGEDIDLKEGVRVFCLMALGGCLLGILFGLATCLILFLLDRKLNSEENVVQIVATITMAYLTFYVAEPVSHTSGVIAVVFCGFTTKAFGQDLINDVQTMTSFWVLVEHILNTVLFGKCWLSVALWLCFVLLFSVYIAHSCVAQRCPVQLWVDWCGEPSLQMQIIVKECGQAKIGVFSLYSTSF